MRFVLTIQRFFFIYKMRSGQSPVLKEKRLKCGKLEVRRIVNDEADTPSQRLVYLAK
jgi:hypothetical protein